MKKLLSLVMAVAILLSTMAGFTAVAEETIAKESPVLAEKVAAGELPALEARIPTDPYVESDNDPEETPVFGGTLRTNNGGLWYFGMHGEEPLFRLESDGTVSPNVAKGYDLSEDGLTYTIYLRDGMKWSDGTPFTATDCVYYYNYVLVTKVDPETGTVSWSNTTKKYNWYMSTDPADGLLKPAQVRYVDDTTFTITLYSPKPTLLQAICIDNKWMFCPKDWYKDIMAVNMEEPHWSGESDLKLIGGEGLKTVTEEEALANAKARSELYDFSDYSKLCDQLGYRYWQYVGRPTLRPWVNTSALTETTLVFERNPYFWKVDADGRQLPYIDKIEYIKMDEGLHAQEIMAGHIDFVGFGSADLATYLAGSKGGVFSIKSFASTSWASDGLQLNQAYKDPQYRALFANIDFRHALSIAVDREEMNEILTNGLNDVCQAAAPQGNGDYIEGAPEKWTEYDIDAANALLDGIEGISKELNADGYRTFVGGENDGKPVHLEIDTTGTEMQAQGVALLTQFYKQIGILVSEHANTDGSKRSERYYIGDEVMVAWEGIGSFNVMLRPDSMAANRTNTAFVGKYGLEFPEPLIPEAGSPMEELINATKALVTASTIEELQAAATRIVRSHYENTWVIGFLNTASNYMAFNNRVHNVPDGYTYCDELRFLGFGKPYTWFIQE
ncbi:MAG: ABC transporter substrate-binding protein [Clostridia bacterium]|nr:ABC transporter substrate-binding protein [Clostridia bacterium]